ncbi:MAG: hypothetical protein HC831_26805 [Chloroflexia bacterium]|nr:hypothetical protein [Chloroflexia bacterium]
MSKSFGLLILFYLVGFIAKSQEEDPGLLTLDRLYNSSEFRQEWFGQTEWFNMVNRTQKLNGQKKTKVLKLPFIIQKPGKEVFWFQQCS